MTTPSLKAFKEAFPQLRFMMSAVAGDPLVGRRAKMLVVGLCVFMLLINGLNVLNSYVGRDFMSAIADHKRGMFWWQAFLLVLVFFALTTTSVLSRYMEESLGLLWRKWMTWRLFEIYADHRVYYRLQDHHEADNPDQRIAEDVKAFTTTSISFVLMLSNGVLTVIAFSGVLWSISPTLLLVSILYAIAGTWLTIRLGKPLVQLNYDQLDREASFRAGLLSLRQNADMIALSRREDLWILRGWDRLEALVKNFTTIIGINRNVGFFTTGYNWLIQLIPALIVAPLYIDGKVEFGVITQSAVAFTQLMGAFSLIITQFQSISSFLAVIQRLSNLTETALAESQAQMAISDRITRHGKEKKAITLKGVSIAAQNNHHLLVERLSVTFKTGQPVLVYGPDASALSGLFRAIAGLWPLESGEITRPSLNECLFISERPYLCASSLRELFMRPCLELNQDPGGLDTGNFSHLIPQDKQIITALKAVGLKRLLEEIPDFGVIHDWESERPLIEQQLLVVARALMQKPRFVLLDRPGSTLDHAKVSTVLNLLRAAKITAITFEHSICHPEHHVAALELLGGGRFHWHPSISEPLKEVTQRIN